MKKLGLILIPLLFVACGKHEVLTNVKNVVTKGVQDGFTTTTKGLNDGLGTLVKGINDSADEIAKGITKGNDFKNKLLTTSGDFTKHVGETIEGAGQMPKNLVNSLIGNDEDSKEKQEDLEADLAALQRQVNELHAEMIQSFSNVTIELGDLKGEISRVESESSEANQALNDDLEAIHTEILQELNRLNRKDRKALSKIRQLQSSLSNLSDLVRDLRSNIGFENYRTHCEIFSDNERS